MKKYSLDFALEDINDATKTDTEASGADVEAIQSMADAEVHATDLDEITAVIEDLDEATDQANAMAERMEASVEGDGEGYTPEAAAEATAALESMFKHLGFTARVMPSTESFRTRSGSKSATRQSVENIKEKVLQFWEGVKKFFKKMWAKLKDFYASIFDSAVKLANRAKKMEDRLQNDIGTMDKTDFESESIAKAFSENGVFDKKLLASIGSDTQKIIESLDKVFVDGEKLVPKFTKMIQGKPAKGAIDELSNVAVTTKATVAGVGSFKPVTSGDLRESFGLEYDVYQSPTLLNGSTVVMATNAREVVNAINSVSNNAKEAISKAKDIAPTIKIRISHQKEEVKDFKVDTLTQAEMHRYISIAGTLAKVTVALKKNNSKVADIEKELDSAISAVEKAVVTRDALEGDDKELATILTEALKKSIPSLGTTLQTASKTAVWLGVATGNKILDYVQGSLSQYKK